MACDSVQRNPVSCHTYSGDVYSSPGYNPLPVYNPLYSSPGYNPLPVYNPLFEIKSTQNGWVCQKCGRSWAPSQYQCYPCNNEIDQKKQSEQLKSYQSQAQLLHE